MNHILLVILLETLPIILFSSSTVIEDPLIQYCGPGQNGSGNTHGCFQSISEFQFGNINQNVLNLSSPTTGTSSRWTLRCQATYPIRWVIQSYNGRVRQRGNSDSLRMNQNPFQNSTGLIFYQDIWISDGMGRETAMRSASSRILRCESFSNSSLASVIFLNRSGSSTILEFAGSPEDVYIFIVDSKRARQEGSFIVPCAARNIPPLAMNDIKLIETDRHDMRTGQISDGCIECICYAMSGNCEKAPCNDCGSIGQLYWTDGNMYNPNDKPYATCVVDPQCSRQTIKGYMKRYGGDCNNDGIVNCLDYLKIHNTGLDECENADLGHVGTRFNSCWSEQNLTVLDPSTASYDPRLGFRVKGSPNFNNSVYTCSSIPKFVDGIENVAKFVSFAPVNSDLEVEGSVLYRRAEEDLCCHTIPNTRIMSGIHLIFVLCDNITDCDLKFRSNTNLNSVRLQTFMHIPLSGEFAENNSVIRLGLTDDTHHGFIECSGVFQNPPNKNYGSFVKKLDYIFTGLDDDKYLVSDSYPTSAVINIVKQNEASSQDLKHEFRCKISTFVLLPNVRFGIEFQNGTRILIDTSSNRSTYGEATVQQLALPSDVRLAITSWQLLITLKPNVRKLMCFAPWINSTRWAESEIPVTIDSVASSVGAILGYCFASLAIIFLIVAAVVWYKYKKAKLRKRTMTEDEIKEFYHGNPNEKKAPDGTVIVENIAFNEKMKIPSESLHTDKEVLGQGEFGIVYKGTYQDHVVAVKMTKPNADILYFKAFLKEIKVMAYIGEHKNIVKFFGAVVDNIKTRICLAVIELSLYGNLHDFLRDNSTGFTNLQPEKSSEDEPTDATATYENELKIKFNLLDLISFCEQIASGMNFMGRKNVIHGDLATRNVLVFENNVVKITDFGLSRKLYGCANYVKTQQAPLPWRWLAVETLRYLSFSTKSDVWAFGVTAWEIFTLAQVPFAALNWTLQFVDELEAGLRLQKPNHSPESIYEMMLHCWENNPDDRPTFATLESFFKNFLYQQKQLEVSDYTNIPLPTNVSHLHPLP